MDKKGKLSPSYIGLLKETKVVDTQVLKLEFLKNSKEYVMCVHEKKRLIVEPDAILECKTKKL